jgi:hypothetical protein
MTGKPPSNMVAIEIGIPFCVLTRSAIWADRASSSTASRSMAAARFVFQRRFSAPT